MCTLILSSGTNVIIIKTVCLVLQVALTILTFITLYSQGLTGDPGLVGPMVNSHIIVYVATSEVDLLIIYRELEVQMARKVMLENMDREDSQDSM